MDACERLDAEVHAAGVELLEIEDVVDEAAQTLGVLVCDVQKSPRAIGDLSGGSAVDEAERAPDGRQRRPQLVADGGHELALETFDLARRRNVADAPGVVPAPVGRLELEERELHREDLSVPAPRRPFRDLPQRLLASLPQEAVGLLRPHREAAASKGGWPTISEAE